MSEERFNSRASLLDDPATRLLRFVAYCVVAAFLTEAIVEGASRGWFAAVGAEGGPIEHAQYLLCGAAAVVFASASRRSSFGHIFALAACGAALGVIREADAFLDHVAFRGAYKVPAALFGAAGLMRAYIGRASVTDELRRWVATPSFALTASGAFIVLVYAQIVGQKELWQALMGSSYLRPVKDVAEEIQELLGYFLIFFGSIESYVLALASATPETIEANPGLK